MYLIICCDVCVELFYVWIIMMIDKILFYVVSNCVFFYDDIINIYYV